MIRLGMKYRKQEETTEDVDSGGGFVKEFTEADKELLTSAMVEMDEAFGAEEGEEEKTVPDADTPPDTETVPDPEKKADAPPATTEPVEGAPNTFKSSTGKIMDTTKPPGAWTAADAAGFEALPEAVRKAIHAREDQFHVGLSSYKEEAHFGSGLRQVIAPYKQHMDALGVKEDQAVAYLLDINHKLSSGDMPSRIGALKTIMGNMGITVEHLGGVSGQQEDPPYVDPAVQDLQKQVQALTLGKQQEEQSRVNALRQQASADFDKFVTANPEAQALIPEMLPFIKAGMTLEVAFEKAAWANPATRQARIDAATAAKTTEAAKVAAEKLAAAKTASSANVKSNSRTGGPTAPVGSIDDTMLEVYQKMNPTH